MNIFQFKSATSVSPKSYKVGTLTYTKSGLFALFAWLLWGDFCFTLMEAVVPSVMPLKLKALGTSNFMMQVILTTLPSILNATVCPWVSFKSDRYRSKWGRRIPFILSTLPFLTISLLLMGWSEDIAPWMQRVIPPLRAAAPTTVTIGLIAVLMVMFQFFNMFVNSVFWYLFNDVVPPQFLGRFTGLFRMVGTGAGSLYSFYVFQFAESHMREILTGAALLYCVGFGVMCVFIKEGAYPPPPEPKLEEGRHRGMLAGIQDFFKQSFSVRLYWYVFLTHTLACMGYSMGIYGVFFNKQMNLTLEQMGMLGGVGGIAALVATYFTAIFVDRWHPLRIATYMAVFGAVTGFGGWVWIYVTLPGQIYYWTSMGGTLVCTFGGVLAGATFLPLCMRLFPKTLYGQFCSAQAMLRSVGVIISSLLAGVVMDLITKLCHGSDFAYRWTFLWGWFFSCATAVFFYLAYREWCKLGADENYRPPAPWLKEGFEEVTDKVQSVTARPRAVMISMWLSFIGSLIGVVFTLVCIAIMYHYGLLRAVKWYAWSYMPVFLLLTGAQWVQLMHVRRDIEAGARGVPTRFGVPHHGVLLVNAIQGLCYTPIGWVQTVWMIKLSLEREMIIFSISGLLAFAAMLMGVQIIRWMERPVVSPVSEAKRFPEAVSSARAWER